MTYKEALDVLMHQIQIDVRYTTDFERDHSCLYKCKEALEKQIPKSQNMKHYQAEIFMYTVLHVMKW